MIKDAVISGLRSSGIDVVDLGILPTPTLAFLTNDMGFDAGVMVTASHNPPEFNGIKLFNGNSIGYSKTQESEIEKVYSEKMFRIGYQGSLDQSQGAKERYFQFMLDRFSGESLNHHLRIVVDAGNGAASRFASELFSTLGYDVIPVNDEPDGLFPGRNPEPREDTLKGTVEFMRRQNADLGICFDGDADRVVFCDKEGFLGFNEMLAFASRLAVEESKRRKMATTVETGMLLELALRGLGVEVVQGRVGDVSVAYLTQELDAAIGVELVGVYIMPEIGVAATKSFISQLTIFYLLASAMANKLDEGIEKIKTISSLIEKNIDDNRGKLTDLAQKLKEKKDFYYIARGINFAIACEGALKLKEIAYTHAEGMPAGELKHGILALVEKGTPVVVICPRDYTLYETLSNAAETKARGAFVIGVSDQQEQPFDEWIEIPPSEEIFYPLVSIVPLQLLAYYSAVARGLDPDQPRNLAKSVTVK